MFRSIRKNSLHNSYDDLGSQFLLFQKKLTNFNHAIMHYKQQGFEQLITRQVDPTIVYENKKIVPLKEYLNEREMPLAERIGDRLFIKEGQIYTRSYRSLLDSTDALPVLMPVIGKYSFMIVQKYLTDDEIVYELRVARGGHGDFIREPQRGSIVCAGELYTKNNKLLFADDKTGHFYKDLENHKVAYQKVFELFFPKDLNYTFYVCPALSEITIQDGDEPGAMYKGLVPKIKQGVSPLTTYETLIEKELTLCGYYVDTKNVRTTEVATNSNELQTSLNDSEVSIHPVVKSSRSLDTITELFTTFSPTKIRRIGNDQRSEDPTPTSTLEHLNFESSKC